MRTNAMPRVRALTQNCNSLRHPESHSSDHCRQGRPCHLLLTPDPDLWLYRERTLALLKRYLRISIEVGRLPSILGRELFRSKVTSYRMSSFEDGVIFVHDVERALGRLEQFSQQVIALVVFQECTQEETAEALQCGRRTVCREFPAAVDRISEIFLEGGLLNRLPAAWRGRNLSRGLEHGICSKFLQTIRKNISNSWHNPSLLNAILEITIEISAALNSAPDGCASFL